MSDRPTRITPRIETEGARPYADPPPPRAAAQEAVPVPPQIPIMPRIQAEDLPAPRLEALPDLPDPAPRKSWSTAGLVASGVAVLVLGLSGVETSNLIADEFVRGPVLGWATLGLATTGFGLVFAGFWREAASLAALRGVDKLRADLAGTNATRRVRAARDWVRHLPEAPTLLPAIDAINDPDAVLALLRSGPAAALRARAEALGRTAAIQSVAGIAAMPSAGLAGLFIAWRGLRLIRQVAALHGLRPGLFGTMALLRRTALTAGAVVGTEMAANAAAHAILSSPVLQTVAGDMAGAGVAARRLMVLARAAEAACSPVPPA